MMDSPRAIVNVFPIFHRSAELKKNALFVQKTYCLAPSYVHEEIHHIIMSLLFTFLVRQSSESDGIRVETWKMASTVEVA